MASNNTLIQSMRSNTKIQLDAATERFYYKVCGLAGSNQQPRIIAFLQSKYQSYDLHELLQTLRQHPRGVPLDDLEGGFARYHRLLC
jgi:hypothetical protein